MKKNKKDHSVFTYTNPIMMTDTGLDILQRIGEYFSLVRNFDYSNLVSCHRNGVTLPSKHERRTQLVEKFALSKREADNIVYANSEQFDLVQRTSKDNISDWTKEKKNLEKRLQSGAVRGLSKKHTLDMIAGLDAKIRQSQRKAPSCCFGGAKLQRMITRYPRDKDLREDWHNKRLFLTFMGETGRKNGNCCIRLNVETGTLTLKVSTTLQSILELDNNTYVIGSVKIKNGKSIISRSVKNNSATTYQFVWDSNKRLWRLHISARAPREYLDTRYGYPTIPGRHCGIDQNSGFISCTIIDKHANPLAQRDFYYTHSKELSQLVHELYLWLRFWKCESVSVEKLKGLSLKKRSSFSHAKVLNRTLNTISYGAFTTLLERKVELAGVGFSKVNPHNTSRDTVYWGHDKYGFSIHQKASYLIARRGVGLSIRPRCMREKSPQRNSVSSEVASHSYSSGLSSAFSHDSVTSCCACSDY